MAFFRGDPGRFEQVPRFTPEQQSAFSKILGMGLSGLERPTAGFEPIAQQARTQFAQQTIPSIAERFTAMGGQRSSAFPQALGQAGAGLEQSLAAQQAQYGLQNQGLLQQLLGFGLAPQFETLRYKPQPSGFETGVLSPLFQGLGSALPTLAMGGAPDITSKFSQLLSFLEELKGKIGSSKKPMPTDGGSPATNASTTYQPYRSPSYENLRMLLGGFE